MNRINKTHTESITPSSAKKVEDTTPVKTETSVQKSIKITLDERSQVLPKAKYQGVERVWDKNTTDFMSTHVDLGYYDGDITATNLAARTNLTILKASNNYTPQYYNLSKKAQQAMEQNIWQMDAMSEALQSWSTSLSNDLLSNRLLWKRFLKEESVMELIAEQNQLLAGTTGTKTLVPGTGESAKASNVTFYINNIALEEIKLEQEGIVAPMPRGGLRSNNSAHNEADSNRRKRRNMRNANRMI
jgi:hypothetical protein